jgi:hypothetical protein
MPSALHCFYRERRLDPVVPVIPAGGSFPAGAFDEEMTTAILAGYQDEGGILARGAALDIGKAELVCGVPGGGEPEEVVAGGVGALEMSRSLAELANRLVHPRIERVVMEATSDYRCTTSWRRHGLEPWLVKARNVRHRDVPRPTC